MTAQAGQYETVELLLARSGRDALPLRRSFLQSRAEGGGPGPLASLVRNRQGTALDLYLLGHAVASQEPFDIALPARVWARALGLVSASAPSTISHAWDWLETQQLVVTSQRGRLREVRFLQEDATGRPYVHPGVDEERRGDYFKLPYAYWRGMYPARLGPPAKMMLLVALSLEEGFILPRERGADWYGVSRDTVQRGLSTLLRLGLLEFRQEHKRAPLSPIGYTIERHYRLRPPFGPLRADSWSGLATLRRAQRDAASGSPDVVRRQSR